MKYIGWVEIQIQDGLPIIGIKYIEIDGEMFWHPHCWVDPALDFTDKVREGCEKEFDFFLQHGYHMTRKDA